MKKLFHTTSLLLCFGLFSVSYAQSIETLKKHREAVKYTLDLLEKKIDLEKAILERDQRESKAQDLNSKAERKGDQFGNSSDSEKASKEAKVAGKAMKKAESANKSLERSKDKIVDLEADIRKLESKLQNANYSVSIHEK